MRSERGHGESGRLRDARGHGESGRLRGERSRMRRREESGQSGGTIGKNGKFLYFVAEKGVRVINLNRYIFTGKTSGYTPKPPLAVRPAHLLGVSCAFPRCFAP